MCVKEFLGYNCGHCSVPVLRQCPLSASNPIFPVCKWPAERPIFTNEYCHACSRVVWNIKVLKDEEDHRERHLRGECMCEVIFEGEDREERIQPHGGKEKLKGKGKNDIQKESEGEGDGKDGVYEMEEGSAASFEGHQVESDQGSYGGHALAVEASAAFGGGRRDIEDHFGVQNAVMKKEARPRQEWELQAQAAAYEYIGYYVGAGQNQGSQSTDPGQSYAMPLGAFDLQGQLPMGQSGAGMKWYPPENYSALTPAIAYEHLVEGPPRGVQATPQPVGTHGGSGSTKQVLG